MLVLHQSTRGKILSILRCMGVAKKTYLVKNIKMEYYVHVHLSLLILAFMFIAIYVLDIPTYLCFILRRTRKKFSELYGPLV